MNKDFTDQLSWEEFFKESKKETKILNVKPFNRMIAHSKNFFIISGYGAFTQGYQVIITKDFISMNYSLLLKFQKKLLKKNLIENQ